MFMSVPAASAAGFEVPMGLVSVSSSIVPRDGYETKLDVPIIPMMANRRIDY